MIGSVPDVPKGVFIAAPHTSNWDGVVALTYKVAVGLDIHFFAKHTLFWFPLGNILRALGGIPLNRSKATSAVTLAVDMFRKNDRFFFGLAPEGTRSLTKGWKTGFYRIAIDAGVPVFLGVIDYEKKQIGIVKRLDLSGDMVRDLQACAEVYRDIKGRWPEKTAPIRFENSEQ